MKIVILDAYTTNPGDLNWDQLHQFGEVIVYDRTEYAQTISRAQDAEIVLTNKVVLDASIIDALPNLKYIGILATGANVVDLKHAKSRGIIVSNVPGYSTESVVQTTFAHILNLATRLSVNTNAVRTGEWTVSKDFSFSHGTLNELYGKQLGIVGFGAIGRRVAQVAQVFGMNVVAFGPHLPVGKEFDGTRSVTLDELFRTSDVVSLHCPLTTETRNLVSATRIAEMKKGAWLINTGRGPLLDEEAVAVALGSGQLGGAGLDVLSSEPPKESNPLLKAPNCFITPHNAWASYEARGRLIQITAENIKAFIAQAPQNVVN